MTLYVGYPVSYETACNLFSMPFETPEKLINEMFNKAGLTLYWIDKNLNILGLEVKEVANAWDKYTSVDDALMLILQKKKEVTKLFEAAGVDLSDIMIEVMEGEPYRAFNPQPFLFTA